MKEPNKIPLDPSTPKTKQVQTIPMPKLYPEPINDDLYVSDDIIIKNTKKTDENSEKST